MSNAIVLKINEIPFLVETDNAIQLPFNLDPRPDTTRTATGDFREVVELGMVEREFSEIKLLIVSCCNSLHEAIAEIPRPDKIAVEFGIKLAGETGIPMLTKASGEANFKISVEWKTG